MDKITFIARLEAHGPTWENTDKRSSQYGTLRICDDPQNDEFFEYAVTKAKGNGGVEFDKKHTYQNASEIRLRYLLPELDFVPSGQHYKVTIEKIDEGPQERFYKEEEKHLTFRGGWHEGTRATCSTCGILKKWNGSSPEDSSGDT